MISFVFSALILSISKSLSSLCICSKGILQNISRSYTEKSSKIQILLQRDMLEKKVVVTFVKGNELI